MVPKFLTKYRNNFFGKKIILSADFESICINKKVYPYLYAIFNFEIKKIKIIKTNLLTIYDLEAFIKHFFLDLYFIHLFYKKKLIIYLHNFSNFDSWLLINSIKNNFYIFKNMKILYNQDQKILELSLFNIIYFRDSYNILPYPLDEVGKLFLNIKKKSLNYKIFNSGFIIYLFKNFLILYCLWDTKILFFSIFLLNINFSQNFKISIIEGLSISSLSFKVFRKLFYKNYTISNFNWFDLKVQNLISAAFTGGLVNLYKPFGKNLFFYDINSSYPYSMTQYLPSGDPIYHSSNFFNSKKFNITKFFGFLNVDVYVPFSFYPFLSYSDESLFNIINPYGKFNLSIFSEELNYAIKNYNVQIINIYYGVSFQKSKSIQKFSNTLFKQKVFSKNNIIYELNKLILNTLFGRLSLKKSYNFSILVSKKQYLFFKVLYNINIISIFDSYKKLFVSINLSDFNSNSLFLFNTAELSTYSLIWKIIYLLNKKKNSFFSAPQISAAITSYSRIYLDQIKLKILKNGGKIYYYDTDSIITNTKLKTGPFLGQLKLVSFLKKGYFLSSKLYWFKNIYNNKFLKFKGLNKEISNFLMKNNFENFFIKNILLKKSVIYSNYIFFNSLKSKTSSSLLFLDVEKKKTSFIFSKRIKIYSLNGVWIDTYPLWIFK